MHAHHFSSFSTSGCDLPHMLTYEGKRYLWLFYKRLCFASLIFDLGYFMDLYIMLGLQVGQVQVGYGFSFGLGHFRVGTKIPRLIYANIKSNISKIVVENCKYNPIL